MEAPKKRGRGRPRSNFTDEARKASQARARARYREKVDVDLDRRRIRLHMETFQQWRKLKEKSNMNSDDGFARLLMKCFSEHAEEYVAMLAPFRTSLPTGSHSNSGHHPKEVHVKEEKPRRKRGRPPGRTHHGSKVQKITPKPPPCQDTSSIETKAPSPQTPRTVTSSPSDTARLPNPAEDLSSLSPSVRSARLAFSRVLAQSFNAMTSPDRTVSAKRNLITSSSGETIATLITPIDDVLSQQEDMFEPSTIGQTTVMGIASIDDVHAQHESTFEPSHRLLVGEGDLETAVYQDSAEEGYCSQSSVQYSGEVVYGDEEIQSLQDQPEAPTSSNAQNFAETNGNSQLLSEPDQSLTLHPEAGLEEESVTLVQPLGQSDSKVVKVPDPTRRSRLNQITGGLLNRLKKRAMTAEPTQD